MMKGYIEVWTLDKGRMKRIRRQSMHSFLKQWVQIIRVCFGLTTDTATKDITGLVTSVSAESNPLQLYGAAGNANRGIVVGTGVDAVVINDYKLQTQIMHGSASGQLSYYVEVLGGLSVVGTTAKFENRRQFENLSGATITINESGLYIYNAKVGRYFCIVRDLFSPGIDVTASQIIEVRYTFKATVT